VRVVGARAGARNSVDVGGFSCLVSAVGMRFSSGEPVGCLTRNINDGGNKKHALVRAVGMRFGSGEPVGALWLLSFTAGMVGLVRRGDAMRLG